MAFDLKGAVQGGYSLTEIADYLATEKNFDAAAARNGGYSDQEIINHLTASKTAGFGESLVGGTKRLLSSQKTALTAPFGAEEAALKGVERQEAITERPATDFDEVMRLYEEKGLLPAAKEAVSQIPGAIAEQAPFLGQTYAGAKLGAKIPGPLPVKIAGGLAGAGLGAFLSSAGSNIERQAIEELAGGEPLDINLAGAYGTAIPQAALDVGAMEFGLGRVLNLRNVKMGTEAAERLARESLTKTLTKGTLKSAAAEMPTEAFQQLLERYQANLPLTTPDAIKEYTDAAYTAGLMSPLGGGARVFERSDARTKMADLSRLGTAQQKAYERSIQAERDAQAANDLAEVERQKAIQETIFKQQPLALPNLEPMIQFPDGTVGRQSDFDAYVKTLPEAEQNAARAKAMGYPAYVPPTQTVLDKDTLDTLGIKTNSKVGKELKDLNITDNFGRQKLTRVLEKYQPKVNEAELSKLIASLPKVEENIKLDTNAVLKKVLDSGEKFKSPSQIKNYLMKQFDEASLTSLANENKTLYKGIFDATKQLETGSEADRTSVSTLDEPKQASVAVTGAKPSNLGGVDTAGVDAGQLVDGTGEQSDTLKPKEILKGSAARAKPETLKSGERLLTIQELLNDPNPQQRKAARRKFIDLFRRDETNELIKEGAKLEREERAKYANLKKTQYPVVDQSTNLANILSTLKDKPNYLIEDLKNPNVLDAERQELNQHARDYLLAESLRNKYKVRMTPEERAALEKEGEAVAQAETPLDTEELADVEDQLAQERQEPLEARGDIQNTGETPDTIEATFQKQYGKNVKLARQRGLLNFLNDVSELPKEIGPVTPGTKAVYHKGKGYFITNRINKEDAPRMLLHEIGAHYGLEGMLGTANFKRVVRSLKQKHLTDKDIKAAWNNTVKTYPEYPEGSDNFMQEVIAYIGERSPNNSIFRQIIGYIKQFLSKLGYGWNVNNITAADIQDMVQHSVRVSLAGKIKGSQPGITMKGEEDTGALRPTYYSALSRVITNAQFKNNVSTQSGEQWVNWLNSKTSEAGVKRDELEFSGLLEFLELNKSEKFNKQDILNYLNDNGTKVNEYMYGEGEGTSYSDKDRDEWVEDGVLEWIDSQPDQWEKANEQASDNYDFPYYVKEEDVTDAEGNKVWRVYFEGQRSAVEGTYYFSENEAQDVADDYNREGLDNLADEIHESLMRDIYETADVVRDELYDQWDEDHANVRTKYLDWTLEGGDNKYTEVVIALQNPKKGTVFSHQHWPDISNPIAHYRVNARTDIKGNNVLFVEEIQSDWAQAPRKLRKQHIIELAEKFKVDSKQIAKFVPGDWGFRRKFTPEQEKEYDNIINKFYEFRDARNQLSGQISKLIDFRNEFADIIDKEVRKRVGPKGANEVEYDMTRYDYMKRVLNRDLRETTTASGYKIGTSIIKAILNEPIVKNNFDQYHINQNTLDKLLYKEEQLVEKINDLESKKQALSQSGKIDKGPFVQDTEAWSNLVLKNIIRFAVERGYDKVAFVNGKQAAFKGGKAERIDEVFGTRNADNTFTIYATLKDGGGRSRTLENIRDLDLEDYVGGLADKMRSLKVGETDGWDAGELKLPAQGMVEFYDHYIPRYAAKLIKKIGGTQLETVELIPPNENRPEDEKVGKQIGFTVTSAMKDKAMAGQPLFARQSESDLDQILDEVSEFKPPPMDQKKSMNTFIDKVQDIFSIDYLKDMLVKGRINLAYAGAGIQNELVNKYEGAVNNALNERVRADIAYDQALHGNVLASESAMIGKVIFTPEGLAKVEEDPNNLNLVFTKLKELGDSIGDIEKARSVVQAFLVGSRYKSWLALNQELETKAAAAEAKGDKTLAAKIRRRKKLVTEEQEAAVPSALRLGDMYPEVKEIASTYDAVKNHEIDMLEKAGFYSKEYAEELRKTKGYVPLQRVMDDLESQQPGMKQYFRGLVDLGKEYTATGSKRQVLDVFDNMMTRHMWATNVAVRNNANKLVAKDLGVTNDNGKVVLHPKPVAGKEEFMSPIWINGERKYVEYTDPKFAIGIQGLEPIMGPIAKIFAKASRILRIGVTAFPPFQIAQVLNDAPRAANYSGVERPFEFMGEVLKSFLVALTDKNDPILVELRKQGIVGGYEHSATEVNDRIRRDLGIKANSMTKKFLDSIERFAGASDVAQRRALWVQTMKETGNPVLALNRAMNIIHWQKRGANNKVRILSQVVPFMNAYIQGMDVMGTALAGKGISGKKKAQAQFVFLQTAMKLAILSTLYAWAVGDDEEYQKLDDREKVRSIIIPGTGFSIPVAPDVAMFVKAGPELVYNYITSQGTDTPVDATKLRKGVWDSITDALLGPNLTPQVLRAGVEVAVNKNFLTGNPIVGRGLENLRTEDQFTENTSRLARIIGSSGLISPMNADYLMKGYGGTASSLFLYSMDSAINQFADVKTPTVPIYKVPGLGAFTFSPEGRGMLNDYYDLRDRSDEVAATLNHLKKYGTYDELIKYAGDNKEMISVRTKVNSISNMMKKLRAYRKVIINSQDLDASQKRDALDKIDAQINNQVRMIGKIRQAAGL